MSDPSIPGMPGGMDPNSMEKWMEQQQQAQGSKKPVDKNTEAYRKSSQYNAAQDFFPGMPMSKPEFKKFMTNLLNFISTQIKQEQKEAKKASEELKRSEKGQS